jgi:hypothetical protein
MGKDIEMLNSLMDNMSDEEETIAMDNRFPYLFTKAYIYLKSGPDNYRKDDYFKLPSKDLEIDELAAIESGCNQILQGKGLVREKPFTGLDVRGFNLLFELFHFKSSARKSKSTKIDGKTCFIDQITFKHVVDGSEITYYNLVSY